MEVMKKAALIIASMALAWSIMAGRSFAEEEQPRSCSECHDGEGDARLPDPPYKQLEQSINRDMECADCHGSISTDDFSDVEKPHGENVPAVNCAECHEEAAEVYRKHGRKEVGKDSDIPTCASCHGSHDILPASDRQSQVHPVNLPGTCRTCHTNVDLVKKHEILREAQIKLYSSSIHGKASKKGVYVAATCNDCHSALDPNGKRTAHRILSPADPESTIYHFNIPDTCGNCHKSVAKDYWEGIHGKLVKRGQDDSPVCTHCHGEHGIISPSDPRSPVSAAHVAESTCSPCHESEVLNEKYGLPAGKLKSYIDSYHGLKSKAGDVRVANCASCHGAHRILPHTDPSSSIYPDNLQETCADCHPGISSELAHTPIHETATGLKSGWPHFFTVLYLILIAFTIGFMLLHNGADFIRHIKIMLRQPFVRRMTLGETFQHWVLAVCFIVLAISGFSLRFSEAFWVKMIFGWGGGEGFLFRGLVHRIAAVLFVFCCIWHLTYILLSRRGRGFIRDMFPGKRDYADLKENVRFFMGAADRPRFGRFSYIEKIEYWALIWGAGLMSATGALLWFDNYFVEHWGLPKGFLDVVLVIHYYEAWLATLAIVIWHGYSVLLNPHVYPMNPAWMNGKMPKEMYLHEHPEGPKLKARVYRITDEDEEEEEEVNRSNGSENRSEEKQGPKE